MPSANNTNETARRSIDDDQLPDAYDQLVPRSELAYDHKHNPRHVQPLDKLRRSVQEQGLQQPLIVRPAENKEIYLITDGWQRFQAARDAGWTRFPVTIYQSAAAALKASETASIERDWDPYHWAQYVQSVAEVLDDETDSKTGQAALIAESIDGVRKQSTITQYLEALQLPEPLHLLLSGGPEGNTGDWAALQQHNQHIARYNNMSWEIASYLSRRRNDVSTERLIGIGATVLRFDNSKKKKAFIDRAVELSETHLETVWKEIEFNGESEKYLQLDSVTVRMSPKKKQALMRYCREYEQSVTEMVREHLRDRAEEAVADSSV